MKKKSRLVYFNGKFVEEKDAKISIYDSALMFGDMVFEMTRSFNKKHFKLEEHIDRLFVGLKILRIKVNLSKKEMYEACLKTSKVNAHLLEKHDESRLMINVSRGLLNIYHGIKGLEKGSNVIIAEFPLRWTVSGMGKLFDVGINAVIPPQRVIPSTLMDPKIKNRSRLFYQMANIQVSQFKGENNWALMLDPDGYIAEGSGDNFFIIKDKKIISPEGRNILRGVSRSYIMDYLCPKLGIKAVEKNIEPYDVYNADEAFMSATPFCMLPVTSLDGLKIGNGKVGKIFTKILNKWSSESKVKIDKQIKNWDNLNKTKFTTGVTPYRFVSNK
jgi:branched-chain amino acid aminotransferase